jgi:hypothetical protein
MLTACPGGDSPGDSESFDLAVELTNPANTDVIQTPDVVVNITGSVKSVQEIEAVNWHNDRGGSGRATGKEKFVTGNIVLQLGTNNITITAKDVEGQTTSTSLTVERENTAPSAKNEVDTSPELMYSYYADLSNAAPVDSASILSKPVWLFVNPGSDWLAKGIASVRISCCKGQDGPGEGEPYDGGADVAAAPWATLIDFSGYAVGGTRRARVTATFTDGTTSGGDVFDFAVAGGATDANTAPLISGIPQPVTTVGNQYSFRPSAQDPDGDTMQFSVTNKPDWAKFSKSTGRLYGTPSSNNIGFYDDIVISVSDGQTTSSLMPFAIEVQPFGGGSATLTWAPPTERTDNSTLRNLAGFHIYYGQNSGDYANKITLKNPGLSNYMVDNLSQGQWFFVVTAFDGDGLESNPSNEGSKSF